MKKLVTIISIIALMLSSVCFANVQSRPDRARLVNQTANQFFIKVRNMESSGGVLGKRATIDQSTGAETSSSNGLDAHMVKNTEYGAAAILAVSQYGYQAKSPETSGIYTSATNYTLGDSTTGPEGTQSYYYGLFDMSNNNAANSNYKYTYTATMHSGTTTSTGAYQYSSILYNAAHNDNLKRYVDYYTGNSTVYFRGDATTETSRWRGATSSNFVNATNPVFNRNGGMFGYYIVTGNAYGNNASRCVVVCGSGL